MSFTEVTLIVLEALPVLPFESTAVTVNVLAVVVGASEVFEKVTSFDIDVTTASFTLFP